MTKTCGRTKTDYRQHLVPRLVQSRCAYCGAGERDSDTLKKCQGCRIARYCDKECQTQHWFGRTWNESEQRFADEGTVRAHRSFCDHVYDRTPIECPTRAMRHKSKERAERMVGAHILEHLRRVDFASSEQEVD
jgi:hypothetical protein